MEGPGCSGRAGEDVPSVPAGGAAQELRHTGWGWVRRCWGPLAPDPHLPHLSPLLMFSSSRQASSLLLLLEQPLHCSSAPGRTGAAGRGSGQVGVRGPGLGGGEPGCGR